MSQSLSYKVLQVKLFLYPYSIAAFGDVWKCQSMKLDRRIYFLVFLMRIVLFSDVAALVTEAKYPLDALSLFIFLDLFLENYRSRK